MNMKLIRQTLSDCEQEAEKGSDIKACEYALTAARLLISQSAAVMEKAAKADEDGDGLRRLYMVSVAGANEMAAVFNRTRPYWEQAGLTPKLKERIEILQKDFEKKQGELEEEKERAKELLSMEKALCDKEKELKKLKEKEKKLSDLKEKDLKELQKEIDGWKKKAATLTEQCRLGRKELEDMTAELGENSRLIQAMPDETGMKSVDDLIARAKQTRKEAEERRQLSSGLLDQILAEMERISQSVSLE